MEWNDLAQDKGKLMALGNEVMNLRVPQKCGEFSTGRGTVSFSRGILLSGVSVKTEVAIVPRRFDDCSYQPSAPFTSKQYLFTIKVLYLPTDAQ